MADTEPFLLTTKKLCTALERKLVEADTQVVKSALAFAKSKRGDCAVVADDTDRVFINVLVERPRYNLKDRITRRQAKFLNKIV